MSYDQVLNKLLLTADVQPVHLQLCYEFLEQRGGGSKDRQIILELLKGGVQSENFEPVFAFLVDLEN